MKRNYLIVIPFIMLFIISCSVKPAKEEVSGKEESAQQEKIVVMIADIKTGSTAREITDKKVEAAMMLAAAASERYTLIPFSAKDSVIKEMNKAGRQPTAINVAAALKASKILFIGINRIGNMLRVDISDVKTTNPQIRKNGIGYGLLHYRQGIADKPIYDPVLVEACQRAFAAAEGDSNMYASSEGSLKVFPAQTIIIGGIDFIDDESLSRWDIFDKKVVNSYDIVETIFDTARKSSNYIIYDIASRDSLFSMFKLEIAENYRPPTTYEIEALSKMDVNLYITGNFKRVADGAILELYLCRINNSKLEVLKTETGKLSSDKIDELHKLVQNLTQKLLLF